MHDYENAVKEQCWEEKGYPKLVYVMSKVGLIHYGRILGQREDILSKSIQVYSMCPGYCQTDMTDHQGPLTAQEGAKTAVFLVNLPSEVKEEWQGQFFENSNLSSME